MLIFGIVITAIALALGAPIYIGFALGSILILNLFIGVPLAQIGSMYFNSIDSFILLGGTLFVLAGNLMIHSGISKALIRLLSSFVARIPGGVAVATVITCTFVGALTGSILATLASVGYIMFPAMIEAKYTRGYSGSVLVSSANLGVLIPPSIIFILFGYLTETSVTQLFIAGTTPGLLLALLLSIISIVVAKKRQFPLLFGVPWKEKGRLFTRSLPAIFMPVIVLGGIYGGIFTPTEAAGVACVYCIIVGVLIYRQLNWKNFWASVTDTVQVMCFICVMLAGGMVLGKAFMLVGIPQVFCNWVISSGMSSIVFLLLLSLVFVTLGFFIEGMAMLFITMPIVLPAADALHVNRLHLGVVYCICVTIAGLTPPMSIFLYATCGMFNVKVEELIREVIPFVAVMIIASLIIAIYPQISIWLPSILTVR